MGLVLMAVAAAAGAAAVTPAADALAPRIVGGAVPTRVQDLVGYLGLSDGKGAARPDTLGPVAVTDPTLAKPLRELAALSLGAGALVGALTYVFLRKLL